MSGDIRRFELVNEGSMKFWEIDPRSGETHYGRIGSKGSRAMTSPHHVSNKINEKMRKGYVEITDEIKDTFPLGSLVSFRNDRSINTRRWLEHSVNALFETDTDSAGTVIGIVKECPEAPHWNVYEVTAGSGIHTCAGVYLKKID